MDQNPPPQLHVYFVATVFGIPDAPPITKLQTPSFSCQVLDPFAQKDPSIKEALKRRHELLLKQQAQNGLSVLGSTGRVWRKISYDYESVQEYKKKRGNVHQGMHGC
jgi:hypothetical protein